MSVSSAAIQDLLVAALRTKWPDGSWKTLAQDRIFVPRTWPTTAGVMPIVLVQSPSEHKQGKGRSGAPQFDVTATFRVVGRVTALADTGDAGAIAAEAAVNLLQRQIEVAVINDYDLRHAIQQFSSVQVTTGASRDGEQNFAELVMDFALEFYQGPEAFHPIDATDIAEVALYVDLLNLFSATGDFTGAALATPFVATAPPPPRTSGPDGRAEGGFIVPVV